MKIPVEIDGKPIEIEVPDDATEAEIDELVLAETEQDQPGNKQPPARVPKTEAEARLSEPYAAPGGTVPAFIPPFRQEMAGPAQAMSDVAELAGPTFGGAMAGKMVMKAAPQLAKLPPFLQRLVTQGAVPGATAATLEEAQDAATSGEMPSPKRVGKETLIETLFSAAGGLPGRLAKKFGVSRVKEIFKKPIPLGRSNKTPKVTLTEEKAKDLLDKYVSPKGMEGTVENLFKHQEDLSQRFSSFVKGRKEKINPVGVFSEARKRVDALLKSHKIKPDEHRKIMSEIDDWQSPHIGQKWLSFEEAQTLKQTLDDHAGYGRIKREAKPTELTAKQEAARLARRELFNQMERKAADFKKLSKEFSDYYEARDFILDAAEKAQRRPSLAGRLATSAMPVATGTMAYGAGRNPGEVALATGAGFLPPVIKAAYQSPGVAKTSYEAGKVMSIPELLRMLSQFSSEIPQDKERSK